MKKIINFLLTIIFIMIIVSCSQTSSKSDDSSTTTTVSSGGTGSSSDVSKAFTAYSTGIGSATTLEYYTSTTYVFKNQTGSVRYTYSLPGTSFPVTVTGTYVFTNYTNSGVTVNGRIDLSMSYSSASNYVQTFYGALFITGAGSADSISYNNCTLTYSSGTISYSGSLTIGGKTYQFANLMAGNFN